MIYSYVCTYNNSPQEVQEALENYVKAKNLTIDYRIIDKAINRKDWQQRELYTLLKNRLQPQDTLIVYEASNLARSTAQILEILQYVADRNIKLHLAKYDQLFPSEQNINTEAFLQLIQNVESDFVAKRVTQALARRKSAGLPVGRPKGKKNKTLKLDKHRQDIQKYLDLQISRASIAKLIGCNAQTLYNYIEKREMKPKSRQ